MSKNLKEAFDSIHADSALKESTRAFLREKTGNYTAPEPRRRSGGFRRLAPALACAALLVVGLSGYQAYFTPTSAISIDINPSVELEINRFDRVITVEGLNDDGTALAAELNVRFMSYDDALEQIIASDAIQQCLADDGVLSIVVSGDNEVQQQEILSCAQRCTSGESNAHCYAGSSEDLAEAQALGLPLGKYHAYEELHALDPSITPEEAAGMTMRELRDRIDACQNGDEEESYEGGGGGQHQHGGRWNQHEYRVKQPGQCSGCFCSGRKKGPTVRGGRLVPIALSVRTAKVWLPAANLQYGTDSGAAAVVHSIAAYHSGTYIGEAHAGLRQRNLGSLCSGGSTAAAAAVDIIHGGSVADTGDIPSRDQCGVDRVDGDPRAADLADAAGRNGYMKLCIGAVAVAAAITAAAAAIVAATGAGAAGVGSTAEAAAGTGTGRTGAAAASAGAVTATGVGAAAVAAAGRTSIAGAPDAGAGIAGIIGTCHIQSKPPIQWFAPSYSAGGKSVRDFLPGKNKGMGNRTGKAGAGLYRRRRSRAGEGGE